VLEAVQRRLDKTPDAMTVRRRSVEHVFGTFKHWMGYTHFLTRRLPNVGTEMSLNVLAYNRMRVVRILGFRKAMRLAGA
jgi:Transposase DDE domain